MSLLNSIAIKNGTDKSSEIHNYCTKYEKYLPFNRYENLSILEIGVFNGESLKTWKDFYYNAKITGIDIEPHCKQYEDSSNNIFVEIGSQYDKDFLINTALKHGKFDMILDDGSHMNHHVIFSFKYLWDSIKSGGVYVVEDTSCSYWELWGGGYKKEGTMVEYFKNLTDDVNFRGLQNFNMPNVNARREDWLTDLSNQVQPDCVTDIESINFLNGIIIITKR